MIAKTTLKGVFAEYVKISGRSESQSRSLGSRPNTHSKPQSCNLHFSVLSFIYGNFDE